MTKKPEPLIKQFKQTNKFELKSHKRTNFNRKTLLLLTFSLLAGNATIIALQCVTQIFCQATSQIHCTANICKVKKVF